MGKDEIWETPSEPYFFKNSSLSQGRFLESFIFDNSVRFFELESRLVRREGDALSRQIKFLISASKELESEKVCPCCRGSKIKFLLFLNYSILDLKLSCCDNPACKEDLKSGRPESLLIPLNLEGLKQFRDKAITIRKRAELVFRQAFGIKKNASPIQIFNKFNEAYLKMKNGELPGRTVSEGKQNFPLNSQSNSEINSGSPENKSEPIPFHARYYFGRRSDAKQIKLFS